MRRPCQRPEVARAASPRRAVPLTTILSRSRAAASWRHHSDSCRREWGGLVGGGPNAKHPARSQARGVRVYGWSEIRTHGTLSRPHTFQACFHTLRVIRMSGHSDILALSRHQMSIAAVRAIGSSGVGTLQSSLQTFSWRGLPLDHAHSMNAKPAVRSNRAYRGSEANPRRSNGRSVRTRIRRPGRTK